MRLRGPCVRGQRHDELAWRRSVELDGLACDVCEDSMIERWLIRGRSSESRGIIRHARRGDVTVI